MEKAHPNSRIVNSSYFRKCLPTDLANFLATTQTPFEEGVELSWQGKTYSSVKVIAHDQTSSILIRWIESGNLTLWQLKEKSTLFGNKIEALILYTYKLPPDNPNSKLCYVKNYCNIPYEKSDNLFSEVLWKGQFKKMDKTSSISSEVSEVVKKWRSCLEAEGLDDINDDIEVKDVEIISPPSHLRAPTTHPTSGPASFLSASKVMVVFVLFIVCLTALVIYKNFAPKQTAV